ncbi:hypothetical protein KOW79_007008 [Hemibagrus wyckioides]|uniref:Ig-like domain-containing protein n=1 Tax=Hemibagrus wyckioides TaxID=337641 RepID=A0A9D3SR89_9TELE|nr:hypothetical protein KOW79_007008 [Hemibagrus wyckioides]
MPLWFLFLSLNILTQAVDFSRPSFLSVKPGEGVTLHCSFGPVQTSKNVFWYKQKFGEMPQRNISLTIPNIKKEDEGLYYCAESFMDDFILSSGTYLAVTGNGDVKVSVLQHGMWDSIRCESGSSTHTCVYNVSKNILSFNDTGTYYCTMALCGNIVSGNGTPVQYENVPKLGW